MSKYRTIFISDVHLGTHDSKAKELNAFLKQNSCDSLIMIGDIIDGWKIQTNSFKWKESHTTVVKRILNMSKKGTEVIYIAGNHDEFLRPMLSFGFTIGKVSVKNQHTHIGVDGTRYLVIHGDMFDGITDLAPWLAFLGDKLYEIALTINTQMNHIRHKMGFGYWSLSQYLKERVKSAVGFMFKFEDTISNYAIKRKFDGVICGHVHKPEIKNINGIKYLNSGDWVETCSALVEHHDGTFEIIIWTTE